ncbi:MAG: DUF6967 family protein [Rudaea sp.]
MQITRLERFVVPLTGQEVELQQVDYAGGGMSQLRVRVRERTRFTIVDVDPVTAARWGEALSAWAHAQPGMARVANEATVREVGAVPSPGQSDG